MAFLDDLSKKISQAGQTVVQKTKDFSDVTRVNGLISDEEKKINNNYYQIGKLYLAMHPDDYEPDFDFMITAIRESERKLAEYKQQIKDIKGVVHCEKCGAEVPADVAFCSTCGAPMPRKDSDGEITIKCPDCGQKINKDMRFCTGCGKPISGI